MAYQIHLVPTGKSLVLPHTITKDEFGAAVPNLSSWSFALYGKTSTSLADSAAQLKLTSATGGGITISGRQVRAVITPDHIAALALDVSHGYVFRAKTPGGAILDLEFGLIARVLSSLVTFPVTGETQAQAVTDNDGTEVVDNDGTVLTDNPA